MPGNVQSVDEGRLIKLRGGEDGVSGDPANVSGNMLNQVQNAFAKKYGLVKDAKVDEATQKKLDFLAKLPEEALKKVAQEYGIPLDGVVEEVSEVDDPDANLVEEVTNISKTTTIIKKEPDLDQPKVEVVAKKVEAKGDEERISILRGVINLITPAMPLDEAKKLITDKVNSSSIFTGSKEKILRKTAAQEDIDSLIKYLWDSLLKGEGLGVISSEKIELDKTKEVSNMGREKELDQIERIVEKIASLKKGQDANEPKETIDKPKQVSVDMPKEDDQTEITTSEADAKNAAAGGKKDLTAQQAETGEDKVEGKDLDAGKQTDIDSKNKKVRDTGDDIEGAGRQKTDLSDGMVIKGQQAELGKEGEDTEKDLSVGKKDLGEVKLPKKEVKTTEVAAKPSQKSVEMPKEGEMQKDVTQSTEDTSKGLPGAKSVKMPEDKEVQKVIYTAKFHRHPVRKTASYWDVYSADKPLFRVSLKQAFGLGQEAVENWDMFKSPVYGRTLTALMQKDGAKKVLDSHFDRGNWVTFYNVKTAQMTGETVQESAPSVSDEVPQNMNITDEATEKIDNAGKAIDAPIVDILLNMLAPVISADPETFETDKIMKELKDVFSDDAAIENFAGSLKEKAEALKTEINKEEEGGSLGSDVGEGVSLEKIARMVVAAYKSPKDYMTYLAKIKSDSEGFKKLKEMFNKVTSDAKSVTASLKKVSAKEASRARAKKAIFTARLMVKKGVLARDKYGAKTMELARMDILALDQLKQSIASLPELKAVRNFGKITANVFQEKPDNTTPTPLDKSASTEVKKIWTVAPVVKEDERTFKQKK